MTSKISFLLFLLMVSAKAQELQTQTLDSHLTVHSPLPMEAIGVKPNNLDHEDGLRMWEYGTFENVLFVVIETHYEAGFINSIESYAMPLAKRIVPSTFANTEFQDKGSYKIVSFLGEVDPPREKPYEQIYTLITSGQSKWTLMCICHSDASHLLAQHMAIDVSFSP